MTLCFPPPVGLQECFSLFCLGLVFFPQFQRYFVIKEKTIGENKMFPIHGSTLIVIFGVF